MDGTRDWRMLPAALACWAVAWLSSHVASPHAWLWGAGLAVTVSVAVAASALLSRSRRWRRCAGACLCALAAMLVCATAGLAHAGAVAADPVHAVQGTSVVQARVVSPPIRSERRGHECVAVSRLEAVTLSENIVGPSRAKARLYASGQACRIMRRGGVYRLAATVERARYGQEPWWAQARSEADMVRQPGHASRIAARMHEAFFAVCASLPEQGKILVPGVTLGVLGQDAPALADTVDATYGERLEDRCTQAGIVHLMAVSGGHFTLAAVLARRACAMLGAGRKARALAQASACLALYTVLYPASSVSRALATGLLSAGAMWAGRPRQSVSLLCWSVILLLVVDPSLASGYGFALSCAATLSIAWFADPMRAVLSRVLPRPLAAGLALAAAAQYFTLPVQILMSAQVPLWSLPANLIVNPVMDATTICGLMALALSGWAPRAAYLFAWVASQGTRVIVATADLLGGTGSVAGWTPGVPGALSALAVLMGLAMIARLLARAARVREEARRGKGSPIRANPVRRARVWAASTWRMLAGEQWAARDKREENGAGGERPPCPTPPAQLQP